MGFMDIFKRSKLDTSISKANQVFDGTPAPSEDKLPIAPEWFFYSPYGAPRSENITEIRQYAKSPYVQMIINTIQKQITNLEYDIITANDEDDAEAYAEDIKFIKSFLKYINRNGDSLNDVMKHAIRDVLEIDAGVWVKARNRAGELKEIWPADGSSFMVNYDPHRVLLNYYQYSYKNPREQPKKFEVDEVCYFLSNPCSYSFYGWSPLMSVRQIVEILIQSARYNKEFFKNNALPSTIINIPKLDNKALEELRDRWMEKTQGKPHKLMFLNRSEPLDLKQLSLTNRDMEWLNGQQWYMHLVFGSYGLSPAEVGFYDDVNRASQEGQERISIRNAVRPYIQLFETKINNEIIPELLKTTREECKLKIIFNLADDNALKLEFDQDIQLLTNKVITINELRNKRGLEPFAEEDADNPFAGVVREEEAKAERNEQFRQITQSQQQQANFKPTQPKEEKSLKKKLEIGKNEIEDESLSYEQFIDKLYKGWETKVIRAIETENISTKSLKYAEKTFNSFLSKIFNFIITASFKDSVIKFIKNTMKDGLKLAEDELKVDIGIGDNFNKRAEFFADQQIEGYTLADGKRWHGIKGATHKLQLKILDEVREGIINKESQQQLIDRVKQVFTNVENKQAVAIARTETNRFVNGAKLSAAKDSKIPLNKRWVSFIDDKTSPICKRMHNQVVDVNDDFVDTETSKHFQSTPGHVNCRSFIQLIPKEI